MTKEQFAQLVSLAETAPAEITALNRQEIEAARRALEPYRAKRAIFLAAGFGSRLMPITLNTPKPLVRVNGTRIIDTLLNACLAQGIEEIYIVRGYLAEQFDTLLGKYPMLKFIDNPDYEKANNISSAVLASHLLGNAYVFEADLLVSNPAIIRKYHYCSDVLGIWMERSNDWCLVPDINGNVTEEKVGGTDCYQMVGIYYWNQTDAAKLRAHLNHAYTVLENGRNLYWETVPNQVHRGEYQIQILPCAQSDIVEIDTFAELQAIDPLYKIKGE